MLSAEPSQAPPAAAPPEPLAALDAGWRADPVLRAALAAGLLLRAAPGLLWVADGCVRDECTYIKLAARFAAGEGMTGSAGWIWAPGYPVLLGLAQLVFGVPHAIKPFQVAAGLVNVVLVYLLAARASEGSRRAARIAAWLYAISLHMAFFSVRLWSEVLYSTLLLGALLLLLRAREAVGAPGAAWLRRAAAVGAMAGGAVLFRGVATYMLPLLMVGLVWGRFNLRRAYLQAGLVAALATAVVAPYSAYATHKFGGFILSDRTMGQMMWLGNNDFEPITFDYGNGQLSKRAFSRTKAKGRRPCGDKHDPLDRDRCQAEAGRRWIQAHPAEFLRRIPQRLAQLTNPHSLLTRHLRWGKFKGMPQWLDELLILGGALGSTLTMVGGAAGLAIRGKGAQSALFSSILLYHCAAIAALAGLSRYRVPLEPLLMVYAATLLAEPAAAAAALRAQPYRIALLTVLLAIGLPLVLAYLPSGWPWWGRW